MHEWYLICVLYLVLTFRKRTVSRKAIISLSLWSDKISLWNTGAQPRSPSFEYSLHSYVYSPFQLFFALFFNAHSHWCRYRRYIFKCPCIYLLQNLYAFLSDRLSSLNFLAGWVRQPLKAGITLFWRWDHWTYHHLSCVDVVWGLISFQLLNKIIKLNLSSSAVR